MSNSYGTFTYSDSWSEDETEKNIWVGKVKVKAHYRCNITLNLNRVTNRWNWKLSGKNLVTYGSCTRNGKSVYFDADDDFDLDSDDMDFSYISAAAKYDLSNAFDDLVGNQ